MAINKELLAKVRDKILRVPEAYDQSTYGDRAKTLCGVRACIAGHALIESGYCTPADLPRGARRNPTTGEIERFDPAIVATSLLGLSQHDAWRLFDALGDGWKDPFESRYQDAETNLEQAQAAADYLDDIIQTGKVI